ncbi:hypothetical protein EJ04DRAFT_86280 [Polyplosphaeria fusca]|uniref:Caib baif family enzyme n=1 Tax=Polyplosphaeria fusca TaxID=682080 RepID=A0A9P4QK61_9PLEO|nr:hypothetical protein EJ04DRAFT_86280 [Polyplosphaeria fusca]
MAPHFTEHVGTTRPSENQSSSAVCHIVTPVGCLGYGLIQDQTDEELTRLSQESPSTPKAIILDAGSTDSGPRRLALGKMGCPRASYVRDLTKLMALVFKHNVPLLFSSAGGDGSDEHVDELVKVIQEIVAGAQKSRKIKVLPIYSGLSKPLIKQRLQGNAIRGCGTPVPMLTNEDIDRATRIVAQMGAEPFMDAMIAHPDYDVIVGGRSYDPSPYVAFAAYHALGTTQASPQILGADKLGGLFHMGKLMECGGQCATPKSAGARATVYEDGSFDVIPLDPNARCIPTSVAAHTLYEKTRPDLLLGPGGTLDLTESTYEQLSDERTVRCRGSTFRSLVSAGKRYTVKLEGARIRGYRSASMGAFRDPALTSQLDSMFQRIRDYVTYQHKEWDQWWELDLHKFGAWRQEAPGEVWVICEALAQTQELATSLANTARIACIHAPYPGQKATSGNFAFGIGGIMEVEMGPNPEFCVYHVMELEDGEERGYSKVKQDSSVDSGAVAADSSDESNTLFTFQALTFHPEDHTNAIPISSQTNLTSRSQQGASTKKPYAVTHASLKAENFVLPPQIVTLGDITPVLRSKNAGPYEITFDILFPSPHIYNVVKESGFLTVQKIAQLYDMKTDNVIYCGFFDQAWAFKATIPRMRNGKFAVSGSFGEEDVHGSQMYLPLTGLKLPQDLIEQLRVGEAV